MPYSTINAQMLVIKEEIKTMADKLMIQVKVEIMGWVFSAKYRPKRMVSP